MKTLKTLALATAVSAGLLASAGAMAATDGNLSATSSKGEFEIKLYNKTEIQVFNLRNLELAANATGDITRVVDTTPACVYTNALTYSMALESSSSTSNNFELKNGSVDNVNYTVTLRPTGDTTPANEIFKWEDGDNGAVSGAIPKADNAGATSCENELFVSATSPASSAAVGVYTDTVYVTVAPL